MIRATALIAVLLVWPMQAHALKDFVCHGIPVKVTRHTVSVRDAKHKIVGSKTMENCTIETNGSPYPLTMAKDCPEFKQCFSTRPRGMGTSGKRNPDGSLAK